MGPLITGENPFLHKIIKTQTNSQIVNYTSRNHGLVTGAHGPGNHSDPSSGRPRHPSGETPPRSRGLALYCRNFASLEGRTPPRAKLRFARGQYAPSGGSLPRSRAVRTLGRVHASLGALAGLRSRTHSPDRSIKCSNTSRAPGSRANPCHAVPLTPPGNHIPVLFRQPPW
jgi:hypothetical protein